jgi:hypothetical protein
MYRFKDFTYLDVQKTGSTYISKFLRETSTQNAMGLDGHAPVKKYGTRFYFISVRHPFKQYKSLYQYGCQEKGGLFLALNKSGNVDFYDSTLKGFNSWMEFMLESDNAKYLEKKYAKINTDIIGLNTFRFLYLGIKRPIENLTPVDSYKSLQSVYEENKFFGFVVKNETLSTDLGFLAQNHLSAFLDAAKVEEFLARSSRINPSTDLNFKDEDMDKDIYDKMREKERFLLETFYEDQ